MLRKKFGGPRVSAAKQVVALKTAATPVVAEEPAANIVPSSADITVASTIPEEVTASPQKLSNDLKTGSQAPQATSRTRTESIKETPAAAAVVENDADVEDILPTNAEDELEDESFIIPTTPIPAARVRTFSQTSMFSTTSTTSAIKRKKRAFEKDEELDAARFTMADLIDWRPKTENTLRSKWKEAEKKFKEEGFAVKNEKKEEAVETEIGPKVKMDEQGNVIIDEESLVIRRNPENSVFETVDDDLIPKKLNSLSFKRNYSRATNWSEIETELFYEVLSSTGTDFSLMQEYLPFKTRADLKKKFNKEEKVNLKRINATLSKPSILNDDIIKGRIEKYVELIDREKEKKIADKLKKKKKPTEAELEIIKDLAAEKIEKQKKKAEEKLEKQKKAEEKLNKKKQPKEERLKKKKQPKEEKLKKKKEPSVSECINVK
uniref:Myb-like domain-containing protein n=1 Tax=Panagrolaimus sp. ES5 TaxID=591445 RepID=A0AC34FV79_9BILA